MGRHAFLLAWVGSLLGALTPGGGVPIAHSAAGRAEPIGQPMPALGAEVAELRTRYSRTYEDGSGGLVARLSQEPVNFQDAAGEWQAIDNSLRRASEGFVNAANSFGVRLPGSLVEGPVVVSDGQARASFALHGARDSAAAVDVDRATYRQALPGVDVRYDVRGDALKETLVLADRSAQSSFAFDMSLADGLRPRLLESGLVELVDAKGDVQLRLDAPFMRDAAGAESREVRYRLDQTAGGWRLSVVADRAWLDSDARRFPVEVDPSVLAGPVRDCSIKSGANATTNYCSAPTLEAGWGSSFDRRSLLYWNVQAAIPADAEILYATLDLHVNSASSASAKQFFAYPLSRSWSSSVTWNKYDGVNNWTTAGGQYDAAGVADYNETISSASAGGEAYWGLRKLTQEWVNGTRANNGLLIRDDGTSTNGTVTFASNEDSTSANRPEFFVAYTPRLGELRGDSYFEQQLSDRMTLKVNQQNGNLLVQGQDLTVPGGTGPDMEVSRVYNSMDTEWGATPLERGWRLSTGDGFRCDYLANNDVEIRMESGQDTLFHYDHSTTSYITPPGYDMTLVKNSSTLLTLTENKSQVKHKFALPSCRRTEMVDRNGRTLSFSYDGSDRIDTITDSQDRDTTFDYDGDGHLWQMTDPAGRTYEYTYDGSGQLSQYTDPDGGVTPFEYGYDNRLTRIGTPEDRITLIEYFTSGARAGRVRSITRVTDPVNETGPLTDFNYDLANRSKPESTVTDPNAQDTEYTFDELGRPTKVTDALGRDASTTYTANSNVQEYTAPTNTGLTPNASLGYDGDNNLTSSTTSTDTGSSDTLDTAAQYGPTRAGGSIAGATYLPKFLQNEQDTASGTSGRGTEIEYDNAEGNPTLITKGAGVGSVALDYRTGGDGKPGELAHSQDGRGNQTTYNYDSDGNLTEIVPPTITGGGTLLGSTEIDYSGASGDDQALSRPSVVTDGRDNTATYSYDDLDRVVLVVYKNSGGTEEARYAYAYDGDGSLIEREDTDSGGTDTYGFGYDGLNRLTEETLPGSRTNTYTYDDASNLASVDDAGGTVDYGYDAINRQSSVQEPGAASPVSYSYQDTDGDSDPDTVDGGQKITNDLPNGVTTTQIVDAGGRLLKTTSRNSSSTVLQGFSYDYTLGSNQQALVSQETDKDSNTISYGYDTLDRLLSATSSAGDDYAYTYDAATNIATKTVNAGTPTTYRYNEANQLCWLYNGTSANGCGSPPSGATTYAYDADGNETSASGTRTAVFNRRMQMSSLTPNGSGAISFEYAGPGQAQRTKIGSTDVVNNVLGVSSHTSGGTADYFTRDEIGTFVSQRRPSASAPTRRLYPLTDRLGSTRTITDEAGTVVRRYAYQPYGDSIAVSGTWTASTPIRFAGGELDSTGVYHYGERYYDPALGRWTQVDPLGVHATGTAGSYVYAAGNPVTFVDQTGAAPNIPQGGGGPPRGYGGGGGKLSNRVEKAAASAATILDVGYYYALRIATAYKQLADRYPATVQLVKVLVKIIRKTLGD